MPASRTHSIRMRLAPVVFGLALLGLVASPLRAQEQNQNPNQRMSQPTAQMEMTKPAAILVIYKEDVKAGRVQSHDDLEANFARAYAKVPGAQHYLAMNSLSGPNEAWFMQPYNSLEEVQKESQASDQAPTAVKANIRRIASGEVDELTNQVAITTVYREDLSYNFDVSNLPKTRYIEVVTYRVRTGHENDFMEAAKLVRSTYEKANIPMEWATYEVFAGAPAGTFYVFRALDSLAKADPTNREKMQAFGQALGTDGEKRLNQLVTDGIAMREVNLYAFNPKTSFAPPEFAAADSFWSQTAQMAQVCTSGKTKTQAANKTNMGKKKQ